MASSSETESWRTRWSTSNPLSVIFTPVHTAHELYTLVCVYKSMSLKRHCTVFLWGFGEARHIHHQLYWQNTTKIYNRITVLSFGVSVSDTVTVPWYPTAHFWRVFKQAALFFPVSLNAADGVLQLFFCWRWAVVCLNSDEVWIMEFRPLTTVQTNWAAHHWFLILCDVSESQRSFLQHNLSQSTDGKTMWTVYSELSECVNI